MDPDTNPEDPRDLEGTVDRLEEKVLGHTVDPDRGADEEEPAEEPTD
jgi:hypothetical protein